MEVFDDISDDDLDFVEFMEYERRPYVVRQRNNPFEDLDDTEFFVRFRLKKETVLDVLEQIEQDIEFPTNRNHSISPVNQLLLTVRYYATGNFLLTVADTINVSKSSACHIIRRVTHALASLAQRYINMPANEDEILQMQSKFYDIARMPRIIGSLDCTHVRIQSPGGHNAETFQNRKGYFSVNVQTVSDPDLKILDIVARWPGSVHDQTVFNNSAIKNKLENGTFGNSILVADSGYTNSMHVITPLLEPHNEVEQLYNESIKRTRNPVERQYGVMKRRFPILAMGLRLKMVTSLEVIVACAVLHNIAILHNEEQPPPIEELENPNYDEDIELEPLPYGNVHTARDILLQNYFPTLL